MLIRTSVTSQLFVNSVTWLLHKLETVIFFPSSTVFSSIETDNPDKLSKEGPLNPGEGDTKRDCWLY